ncbi:hypothetical protein EKK58_12570 [Candidatus Dependentiae bacterium]|nr:MAG: hypothetical protein EKK58_12570 [Candidatus Dependentiae bacterium]
MNTELELYTAFQAICCLATREIQPTIRLPAHMQPAPHMQIINPQLFITTALNRLSGTSPRLRGISERMLKAVIKVLNVTDIDNGADF